MPRLVLGRAPAVWRSAVDGLKKKMKNKTKLVDATSLLCTPDPLTALLPISPLLFPFPFYSLPSLALQDTGVQSLTENARAPQCLSHPQVSLFNIITHSYHACDNHSQTHTHTFTHTVL